MEVRFILWLVVCIDCQIAEPDAGERKKIIFLPFRKSKTDSSIINLTA